MTIKVLLDSIEKDEYYNIIKYYNDNISSDKQKLEFRSL